MRSWTCFFLFFHQCFAFVSLSPSVPTAAEATQGALIQRERWSFTGVFISIRANVRPPSYWWIHIKLYSSHISSCSAPLRFSPTPTF